MQTPNEHTARRRGRFIVPVSLHNQIYIFISPNTCFHFIEYIHSFQLTRISVPHYVGAYIYAGTINRPLQLLVPCHNATGANWNNVANTLQNIHIQLRISQRTPTKTPHEHFIRRRGRFIVPVS